MTDEELNDLESLVDTVQATIHTLEVQVAVLTTELSHNKTSLELQAKEYERRLSELNTSHSLLTERMWKLTIALISAIGALAARYLWHG